MLEVASRLCRGRWRLRPANTPDFNSRDRYARGLKPTAWFLPPLTRFCVKSMLTVGYVRAIALTSPTAGFRSPLTGLKSGVLAGRLRHTVAAEGGISHIV